MWLFKAAKENRDYLFMEKGEEIKEIYVILC